MTDQELIEKLRTIETPWAAAAVDAIARLRYELNAAKQIISSARAAQQRAEADAAKMREVVEMIEKRAFGEVCDAAQAALASDAGRDVLESLVAVEWQFADDLKGMNLRGICIRRMLSPYYAGERFAVRQGSECLSVNGEWEIEPIPSSRDDEFYARFRFPTLEAAVKAAEAAKGGAR